MERRARGRAGRARALRQAAALTLVLALLAGLAAVTGSARLPRADFVMNNGAEVQTLDPHAVTGQPEGRVLRALFEGLTVKHPETLQPLPGVAESWRIEDGGRRYLFRLRPDACWIRPGIDPARFGERGEALSAHDFVWSWERLLNPRTAAEYAYQLWTVVGAREYTRLPLHLDYAAELEHGAWIEVLPGGRARLGLTGYRLAQAAPDAAVVLAAASGAELAAGEPFVQLAGSAVACPLAGRVVALRAGVSNARQLSADPYGAAGWLLELELAPDALAAARAQGRVLSEEEYRSLVFRERVGLRALDERTLEVELVQPTPYFLDLVSLPPLFPLHRATLEEAARRWPDTWQVEWVRPENIVTNGPFRIVERRINDRMRLVKSPVYWDADAVAMRSIDVLAIEHSGTMLNLYLTGEVDWIDRVTPNLVPRLMRREDFAPMPYLASYFYRVNVTRAPLDDVRVRRALALAIDRRALTERITKKGERPSWSLVPHGMAGYQQALLEHAPLAPDESGGGSGGSGYEEALARDGARARELLAEAGFGSGGRSFPTLEVHYNTSEAHRDVAEVIADGWRRTLGIDVKLLNQEWKVYLDTQGALGYDVSRSSWIGDYPDPNTFLDVFVSGGENNRTGWGDPRYDDLIERAAREPEAAERMRLLHAAEQILMEELPVLPLYSYASQNLVKPRLGGFFENALDEHSPKFLYWMDDAELARKRAAQPAGLEPAPAGGPAQGLYPPGRARRVDSGEHGR